MKIISFVNEKGGVGKTTATLETAAQLGSMGNKVLLLDLDQQKNTTNRVLKENTKIVKNIAQIIESESKNNKIDPSSITESIVKAKQEWKNCYLIPGTKSWISVGSILESIPSPSLCIKKILAPIKDSFDYILIDLPPAIGRITTNALVASDGYVIPTDCSEDAYQGILNIEKLVQGIKEDGLNDKIKLIGILFTRFQKGNSIDVREFVKKINEKFPNHSLSDIKVPDTTKAIFGSRHRVPVGIAVPDNPASLAYEKVANRIQEISL